MNDKQTELILAIESSCDETSVAVVKDGQEILSNIVASQINSHKRFGGIVPEVASRHHVEQITLCLEEALVEAGVTAEQLTAVAVTEATRSCRGITHRYFSSKGFCLGKSSAIDPSESYGRTYLLRPL